MTVSSVCFAAMARDVVNAARLAGARVPVSFRAPPVGDEARTMRRRPDGSVVVAVRLADRSPGDVLADLVAGTILAQGLSTEAAAVMAGRIIGVLHDGRS